MEEYTRTYPSEHANHGSSRNTLGFFNQEFFFYKKKAGKAPPSRPPKKRCSSKATNNTMVPFAVVVEA